MTGVGDYDESSNAFVRAYQRLPWLIDIGTAELSYSRVAFSV